MALRIVTIVGARPQFIKAAAVSRAIGASPDLGIEEHIVHTGQHYDDEMSGVFFRDLGIPAPVANLGVGSGRQGDQTGRMLAGLETVVQELEPNLLLVYGDTNSTLAGSLVAAKAGIDLAHVEAGLRSFRKGMAEEVNRVVTDRLSDVLFCPTETAVENLKREGRETNVFQVGDVMYDAFLNVLQGVDADSVLSRYGVEKSRYVLATAHRAENTDDPDRLRNLIVGLENVARQIPILMPLHPRTRKKIDEFGIQLSQISVCEPLSYKEMAALTVAAAAISTDSGGLQKEAFFSAVPCITLRDETEWIETVEAGWNELASPETCSADQIADRILSATSNRPAGHPPKLYGNGDAGEQIVRVLSSTQ